ncbi:MAG: tyrosine-type recombinase/integrase [Lachnospiraceae bacterium]|nr:tyrosine-type recombinase/integrase [Lachnospiraceae bacterium]
MGKVKDIELFTLIHDFFKVYLPNQRKSSPHTIRSYQKALDCLLDFAAAQHGISLSQVTFDMINSVVLSDFLDGQEKNGISVSTRNHRLKSIRAFYSYVAMRKPALAIHQMEIYKVPFKKAETVTTIDYMSETAMSALLAQPDATDKKGLRDQFLLLLLYDTAARIQELVDIKVCDIKRGKTSTVILHGKGSKVRTVPLMQKTMQHFENYNKVFHPGVDEYSEHPLFYSVIGRKQAALEESSVRKLVHAYGTAAREVCPEVPDSVHPHMFRHSRAMHLYQHGMDLTLISQWLGHAQLETTLIYAHADTEQKRKAIEQATPADSPLKAHLNAEKYQVTDDEMLKRLYGLK